MMNRPDKRNAIYDKLLAALDDFFAAPPDGIHEKDDADRYANTLLKHKMLFGSDWPMIAPADLERQCHEAVGREWLAD